MTDPSLLRACQDAPWDMVPRLIYADWLDEHGQDRLANQYRNQFNAKILRYLLPPIQTVAGPYKALDGNSWATLRGVDRTDCKDFRDCVLQIQAERGCRRFYVGPQTTEEVELGQVKGGGIWFRYFMGGSLATSVVLDMSFQRAGISRDTVFRYRDYTPKH